MNLFTTVRCNRQCLFCFQRGLLKSYAGPHFVSMENAKYVVDFCVFSKTKSLQLIGGEPTLHPEIAELAGMVKKAGLICVMVSNAVCSEETIKKLLPYVDSWLINYDDESQYSQEQWQALQNNLEIIAGSEHCVPTALLGNRKPLSLSTTIWHTEQDLEYIFTRCNELGAGLRWDLARPSPQKNNNYVAGENLSKFAPVVRTLLLECSERKIVATMDCPIPLCIADPGEAEDLVSRMAKWNQVCCPPIDVLPDLTVWYCSAMAWTLPNANLQDFKNIMEVELYFNSLTQELRKRPLKEECLECEYFKKRNCQGYCLRLKINDDCERTFASKTEPLLRPSKLLAEEVPDTVREKLEQLHKRTIEMIERGDMPHRIDWLLGNAPARLYSTLPMNEILTHLPFFRDFQIPAGEVLPLEWYFIVEDAEAPRSDVSLDVWHEKERICFCQDTLYGIICPEEGKVYAVIPFDLNTFYTLALRVSMPYVLLARGNFLLHASAVKICQEGAVVFTGDSGAGKSTAARMGRDRPILNDELVVVTPGKPWTVSGTPFFSERDLGKRGVKRGGGLLTEPILGFCQLHQATEDRLTVRDEKGLLSILLRQAKHYNSVPQVARRIWELIASGGYVATYDLYFRKTPDFYNLLEKEMCSS